MVKLYVALAIRLVISGSKFSTRLRQNLYIFETKPTTRNLIVAESQEKLLEINDESMLISPHQLKETSASFIAWQNLANDDFEGFLTCRARELKQNGILALVIAGRPNCLEGTVFQS